MENSKLVETEKLDKRSSPRRVHSFHCTWSGGQRLSNSGVCYLCDVLKAEKVVNDYGHSKLTNNVFGLSSKDRNEIYCQSIINTPFAKCTIKTNPSCNCGKLFLKQINTKEYGELY